jgi:metal-responsive CopG/Arc/MetJ family transcriptional regulator
MSKGTRVYPVRLPADLVAEVELTVQRRNLMSREEPWTFSDFLRIALREKVCKMERSRKPRGRRPARLQSAQGIA